MKAITLWQPWATWITFGLKTIETRTHDRFACLVGQRIAIHAGKRFDRLASQIARSVAPLPVRNVEQHIQETMGGIVVCTAVVAEARWLIQSDSTAAMCPAGGLFGLVLKDVVRVEPPVKTSGHQGIWEWDPAVSIQNHEGSMK